MVDDAGERSPGSPLLRQAARAGTAHREPWAYTAPIGNGGKFASRRRLLAAGVVLLVALVVQSTASLAAMRRDTTPSPVAVVRKLYPATSAESCGSPESFHDCPVTSRLAIALARFASANDADPLCRCQNEFTASVKKGPSLPSGYKGSRSDKVVTATLEFGSEHIVMFVLVHKRSDGAWFAIDTYCSASPGDSHPYRNRISATNPGSCATA